MSGQKEFLKWNHVKVTKILQYIGLRVADIIYFAKSKLNIFNYLPEYQYLKELIREWL